MVSERELLRLLYQADWTKLALSATVTGAGQLLETTLSDHWFRFSREGPPPPFFPPWWPSPPPTWPSAAESPAGERVLLVAPGRRFRVTSADGTRVIGSDGARTWQWFAELPPGVSVGFDREPRPPAPLLLDPAWLLRGYRLSVAADPGNPAAPVTVAGRPGIAIEGLRRDSAETVSAEAMMSWGLRAHERVVAVVDAELGFLLRCALLTDGADPEVSEFTAITLGQPADPALFAAPAGSLFGDGGGPGGKSGPSPGGRLVREGAKLAGGLAAGGLAAAAKHGRRHADPFATATAEAADPDAALPDDEPLPGWALDASAAADVPPVTDEVLELLHRGGLDAAPFAATVHVWSAYQALADWLGHAVPPAARRAGFGGVGRLVDTLMDDDEETAATTAHATFRLRFGGWQRYRIDQTGGLPRSAPATTACDGERTFRVYDNRVEISPAAPFGADRGDTASLLDGAWLLGDRLSGGEPAETDGRPGYHFIATGGVSRGPRSLSWLPERWLPAAGVVDASSGRLLRLTRYRGGQVASRVEFRSVTPLGDDADFGFTPPPGLRVVDHTAGRRRARRPGYRPPAPG
jgi:hypothetical protein